MWSIFFLSFSSLTSIVLFDFTIKRTTVMPTNRAFACMFAYLNGAPFFILRTLFFCSRVFFSLPLSICLCINIVLFIKQSFCLLMRFTHIVILLLLSWFYDFEPTNNCIYAFTFMCLSVFPKGHCYLKCVCVCVWIQIWIWENEKCSRCDGWYCCCCCSCWWWRWWW